MVDGVSITPGVGKNIATDEVVDGVLGTVQVQFTKLMDGTLDSTNKLIVTSAGAAKVDGSGATQPVSGTVAATQSGTWTVQPGNTANTTAWKVDGSAVTQPVSGTVTANIGTGITKGAGASDATTTRVTIDTGQIGSLVTGDFTKATQTVPMELPSDQAWKTGMSNKVFVAAFSTLTRPANTTAYSAADSISDNGTAGSVTALTATISDTNDDPIFIADILVTSTDTGLAGKRIRAYLFNSDPTASTGVGGGDNAAYSQKKAGYIGSFSGVLETGFSDGTVGRLVPAYNDGAAASTPNAAAGGFLAVKPTSGAKTLFIQYQAVDGFTPSANSTTIIGSARGWQARVA